MILTEENLKEAYVKQVARQFGAVAHWVQNFNDPNIDNLHNVEGDEVRWGYAHLIRLPDGTVRVIEHPPLRKVH
jgi:hypothetical protein